MHGADTEGMIVVVQHKLCGGNGFKRAALRVHLYTLLNDPLSTAPSVISFSVLAVPCRQTAKLAVENVTVA